MLILLSILTSYFWWGVMVGLRYRRELPVREAALYVLCTVLCAYLDYFGLLLVVLQGAALAALAYGALRKAVLLYGNPSSLPASQSKDDYCSRVD